MPKIFTQNEIFEFVSNGYVDARKNERNKRTQLEYEMNGEENNYDLARKLYNRTWKPSPAISFITLKPVPREIFAPQFKDRVVSHVLYNLTYPIFEKYFIEDSYSCRKDKGTLFGINRIEHHIRSCSNNYKDTAYILNLDISGYFMNIKHDILFSLVEDILEKERNKKTNGVLNDDIIDFDFIYYLVKKLIFRDPSSNCIYIGKQYLRNLVPPQKLLINTPPDTGLIIGDVMSQVFSNVYLNPFDQFIKRELKIKHYGRYVDDSRIVHQDIVYLNECLDRSTVFLRENLGLNVNLKKTTITSSNKENFFLGAVLLPHRKYINNVSLRRFRDYVSEVDILEDNLEEIRAHLNSYIGYLSNYMGFDYVYKILSSSPIIFTSFSLTPQHNKIIIYKNK